MTSTNSATSADGRVDLLVRAGTAVLQDDARRIIEDAAIAVADGLIVEIGSAADVASRRSAEETLDLRHALVMPGLVNAHTHLPMTLFRGVADDLPLMTWLEEHIWPAEARLSTEMLAIGARIGCAEMIRTGATALLNGYFHERILGDVVDEVGLRAVLGEGFFSFPSPMFPTADHCWRTLRELNARYADHPRVRTAVTPHAAFTVEPQELVDSRRLAEDLGTPWQIHLAESPKETAVCLEKHGKRPVELLRSLELLSQCTTLHHCVDVTDDEIALLAETGTRVVHNPVSNLKLNSGVAPVQKMLDAGVVVGLGTDGAASSNQLNMFREMGLAALVGKVRHDDAAGVNAQSALDMATRNSALCLGWPELGRLEAGGPADMIALDLSSPNFLPVNDCVSHLVYAATGMEVCMTMVGGRVLYRDERHLTLDMDEVRKEAQAARDWLRE